MKKIAIIIIALCFTSIAYAQECKQNWVDDKPESSSGKYTYIIGNGKNLKQAIIEAVVSGGVAISKGLVSETEIRDSFTSQDGVVTAVLGSSSTLKLSSRNIEYKMLDYCQSYGTYRALVIIRNESSNKVKKLPKGRRHLPGSLFLIPIPGAAQLYKKEKGKGWLFLTTSLAFGGAAYYFENSRSTAMDKFQTAATFNERESAQSEIEQNIDFRNYALGGVAAVFAINFIDALASKGKRYVHHNDRRLHWNVAYSPRANGPMVGVTFALNKKK